MLALTTERLTAEPLHEKHREWLCELHQNPQVMAQLGGIRSIEKTNDYLAKNLAHWQQYGFGLWIFSTKAEGEIVGRAGLRHALIEKQDQVELSYVLDTPFWGQGLATELAMALVTKADQLGIPELVCFAQTQHQASRRVMEKVGFQLEREFVRGGFPHVLYRRVR